MATRNLCSTHYLVCAELGDNTVKVVWAGNAKGMRSEWNRRVKAGERVRMVQSHGHKLGEVFQMWKPLA
jgi:hypothetical protein